MTKKELRQYYLQLRHELTDADVAQRSRALCDHFFLAIDLAFIKVIHIFLPLEKKKEPDTWLIIDRLRREFPHVQLAIPKVMDDHLENIRFEGLHQLQQNKWGIWEPQQGVPTKATKIDLVIVPLLAYDNRGHRVGYGKGFYDRFLKTCRPECQRIGLSFFDPCTAINDADNNDVKLTGVVTTTGFTVFS